MDPTGDLHLYYRKTRTQAHLHQLHALDELITAITQAADRRGQLLPPAPPSLSSLGLGSGPEPRVRTFCTVSRRPHGAARAAPARAAPPARRPPPGSRTPAPPSRHQQRRAQLMHPGKRQGFRQTDGQPLTTAWLLSTRRAPLPLTAALAWRSQRRGHGDYPEPRQPGTRQERMRWYGRPRQADNSSGQAGG